jgi:hypothetical protein
MEFHLSSSAFGPDLPTVAELKSEADDERLVKVIPGAGETIGPTKDYAGQNRDGEIGSPYRQRRSGIGASASPFCLKMDTPSPQKAFLQWFSETAPRFAVPVQIKEPNDRVGSTIQDCTEGGGSLHLEFTGNPALSAALINSEINFVVEWQGECWDFLLSLDVLPEQTADGYVCGYCHAA